MLGIAKHAGEKRRVAGVPVVDGAKTGRKPLAIVRDVAPYQPVRRRIAVLHQAGARGQEAALVGKVRIEGVPLHAGALRHHAERRRCRPDAAVQINRRLDDALPRLSLLLGAFFQGVSPGHGN
jgi:hypothetical protein